MRNDLRCNPAGVTSEGLTGKKGLVAFRDQAFLAGQIKKMFNGPLAFLPEINCEIIDIQLNVLINHIIGQLLGVGFYIVF